MRSDDSVKSDLPLKFEITFSQKIACKASTALPKPSVENFTPPNVRVC